MTSKTTLGISAVVMLAVASSTSATAQSKDFSIDRYHSSLYFMVSHFGYSNVFGRFGDFQGEFAFDEKNPAASKVKLVVKTDSVDTND